MRTTVAPTNLVRAGVPGGRAALLVLTILLVALSGCLDKDRDGAGDGRPLLDWLRNRANAGPDPTTPAPCDGCIPLENTGPLPPIAAPTPPERPRVDIPYPRLGDQVHITGRLLESPAPDSADAFPFPAESDHYQFSLRWSATHRDAGPGRATVTIESDGRLLATPDGDAHATAHSLEIGLGDLAVQRVEVTGTMDAPGSVLPGSDDPHPFDWSLTAPHIDLFWAGADLWGRSLTDGDTWRLAWTPPGKSTYEVHLTYRVERIDDAGVIHAPAIHLPSDHHHHDLAAPPAQPSRRSAQVGLTATDTLGNTARWTLTVLDGNPYPLTIRRDDHRILDGHGQHHLPPLVDTQSAWLMERGTVRLDWSGHNWRNLPSYTTMTDSLFRPDERLASEVLDRAPLYPLAQAVGDLLLLDNDFRTWWDEHPRRVLIEAQLQSQPTSTALPMLDTPVPRDHTWRFAFADGHANTQAWTVTRAAVAGLLAPAPHHMADLGPIEAPYALRTLDAERLSGLSLASGEAALAVLHTRTGDAPIDRAHYALTVTGAEVGGTLRLGRSDPPAGASAALPGTTPWAALITEDLATGHLLSEFVRGPY